MKRSKRVNKNFKNSVKNHIEKTTTKQNKKEVYLFQYIEYS